MRQTPNGASKEALFCIGSNCGDREGNVGAALKFLSGLLSEFRHSAIYASPDCHGGQQIYMNAVCIGKSPIPVSELEKICKEFELSMGRNEAARKAGNVPVDMDIVGFDGEILRKRDYSSEFFMKGYREIS